MIFFIVCMAVLGIFMKKNFWPRIPNKYLKYRGLAYSLCIVILSILLKIPLEFSALAIPTYILIFYGLFIFWRDRKI